MFHTSDPHDLKTTQNGSILDSHWATHGTGAKMLAVSAIAFAITNLLAFARIFVRAKDRRFALDDYLFCAAVVGLLCVFISFHIQLRYGSGRHEAVLSDHDIGTVNLIDTLILWPFYIWTTAIVKSSFIATINRLFGEFIYKPFLLTLVVLLYAMAITCTTVAYVQCRPLKALWDYSYPRSVCLTPHTLQSITYAVISFLVATDIICCLLALYLMLRTRFSLHIKLGICAIAAVCLAASMVCVPRYQTVAKYSETQDATYEGPYFVMYSMLELDAAIIAISLPALNDHLLAVFRRAKFAFGRKKIKGMYYKHDDDDGDGDDDNSHHANRFSGGYGQQTQTRPQMESLEHGLVVKREREPESARSSATFEEKMHRKLNLWSQPAGIAAPFTKSAVESFAQPEASAAGSSLYHQQQYEQQMQQMQQEQYQQYHQYQGQQYPHVAEQHYQQDQNQNQMEQQPRRQKSSGRKRKTKKEKARKGTQDENMLDGEKLHDIPLTPVLPHKMV